MQSRHARVLVDAHTLGGELASGAAPVLLDVRWELGDPAGREHYESAHLPGAVFVDLDAELSGPPTPGQGRHPLPRIEDLQSAARRWGLRGDSPVVVYDNTGGRAAARAWWLLRWAGHRDVRLLDGGLGAWLAAGLATEAGPITPAPGDVVLRAGAQPTVTADDAGRWPSDGVLLDARPAPRYRGEVEPLDSRPGHIPGAVSAPTDGNLSPDGTFLADADLAAYYRGLGVGPDTAVAVYCGSGVTAAHDIAALASIGIDAALYPGSWSAWSADPDRRAATGPQPG
jgi:thiosulfate/3-mercaptopyruvate sulfurtransferase